MHKIHEIVGSPDPALLNSFQKYATHMEFNFPEVRGTGIINLIPHAASSEVQDLIVKLLAYNPDNRITASQALRHPWFKDLREQEYRLRNVSPVPQPSLRPKFTDSISKYSRHSDDLSELNGVEVEIRSAT